MMSSPMVLIESQYFPDKAWFALALQSGQICVEAREHYQKRSLRNRAFLVGSQGLHCLTIPLEKGKNERQGIREVKISEQSNWRHVHCQAIQTCYGRSPYYLYFETEIRSALERRHRYLYDLNLELVRLMLDLMRLPVTIQESERYDKTPRLPDWRNCLYANSHPALWYQSSEFPAHFQVFAHTLGFKPFCSVLDLLFNLGPDARNYLNALAGFLQFQAREPGGADDSRNAYLSGSV